MRTLNTVSWRKSAPLTKTPRSGGSGSRVLKKVQDAIASHSLGLTELTHLGGESTDWLKKETLRCKCTAFHGKSFESIALGNQNRKSLKISPQAT